eukprot:582414-Lingulodinium_polyedra.AAC.1
MTFETEAGYRNGRCYANNVSETHAALIGSKPYGHFTIFKLQHLRPSILKRVRGDVASGFCSSEVAVSLFPVSVVD